MANAQVYKGGTPVVRYGAGAEDPTEYGPPFGRNSFGGPAYGPFMNQPPFDAKFNGAAGQLTYPAGCPLSPARMRWQKTNLLAAKPGVDDIIDMLVVPVNHWIDYVRFDVVRADTALAGAAVIPTGSLYTVDPADPNGVYIRTEDAFFVNAATAQGITSIPLDVPSSTFISVTSLVNASIAGTAPNGGGAITITSADGYVRPYYVAPEFVTHKGELRRFQTGGLLLGIKILSEPTNTNIKIWDARTDFYLTTRVTGFESPAII
jgi:hypothetical protein